ncbi:MAG: Hpt domain-containing protein [Myxococcota bacterium]
MIVDPGMLSMLAELRMPGQPDPVLEILDVFGEDGARVVRWIEQAYADSDSDELRRAAHRLKGAAANVGAKELADVLTRVERTAREGRIDAVSEDVARIPTLFVESVTALRALC